MCILAKGPRPSTGPTWTMSRLAQRATKSQYSCTKVTLIVFYCNLLTRVCRIVNRYNAYCKMQLRGIVRGKMSSSLSFTFSHWISHTFSHDFIWQSGVWVRQRGFRLLMMCGVKLIVAYLVQAIICSWSPNSTDLRLDFYLSTYKYKIHSRAIFYIMGRVYRSQNVMSCMMP